MNKYKLNDYEKELIKTKYGSQADVENGGFSTSDGTNDFWKGRNEDGEKVFFSFTNKKETKGDENEKAIVKWIRDNYSDFLGDDVLLLNKPDGLKKLVEKIKKLERA